MTKAPGLSTLGQLKKANYKSRSIKTELRENLIHALRNSTNPFQGIQGFDDTVIPQIQTAILSRHNIILLGLRGQAKTRIARLMVNLLDEWIPMVAGSELNDDPFNPLSRYAIDLINEKGDDTPIAWLNRTDRYGEKLATPDVTVADLIGDVDPIKAATLKLPYNDERVIHYGIIPRSNRGLFVINELPDLQARIQVSLFNILQEGDVQIRGFRKRLPLDMAFVFTANPEDYTNRGSIVTPLKDRIESQILTHYPRTLEIARGITDQEARIAEGQEGVRVHDLLKDIVEQVAFEARESELVDKKSGVSARLTISALENLYSTAERRMLLNGESGGWARVSDVFGMLPSVTGKVELVYEGEVEGIANVARALIGKAMRKQFLQRFPDPEKSKRAKGKSTNPYASIISWFNDGHAVDILANASQADYEKTLLNVKGLKDVTKQFVDTNDRSEFAFWMEFVLHGLAETSQLSATVMSGNTSFKDLMGGVFNLNQFGAEEEDDENNN
ncbi:MAG TPA: magnesium chelatase [Chitinophagales bacterium]|nr:magnesium chelatase [Chitinophagales bacterium]